MKKFRSLVALVLVSSFLTTGCFGSWSLTRKLWQWNDSLGNKFVKTLVFWVFCIIPVYQVVSGLVDPLVLNLIEFWTGHNPMAMKDGQTIDRVVEVNGKPVTITYADHGRDVRWMLDGKRFELQVGQNAAELRQDGKVISAAQMTGAGDLVVRDGAGAVVAARSAEQLDSLSRLLQSSPDTFVQQLAVERGMRLANAQ